MNLKTRAAVITAVMVGAPLASAAGASAHTHVVVCDYEASTTSPTLTQIWFKDGDQLTNPTGNDSNYGDAGFIATNTPCPDNSKVGPAGPKGDTGATGAKGATGADGAKGAAGDKGATGATGSAGATGAAGATGPAGPKGDNGVAGAAGATGATGAAGTNGLPGAIGPVGPTGAPGVKGDTGAAGSTGAAGAAGQQGPVGPKGDTGSKGETGSKGDKGATGDVGPQGVAGPQGVQGVQGVPGKDGYTPELHVTPFPNGNQVDIYTNGVKTGGFFVPNGANGTNGTNGQDGHSPVITTSANGTLGVDIFVDGVFQATILNGINGVDGQNGTDGTNGTNGVNGTSIYGIPQDDGTILVFDDFNSNLTVDEGEVVGTIHSGADGGQGAQGLPGPTGAAGINGADGKDGVTKTVVVNQDGTTTTVNSLPSTGGNSDQDWAIGGIAAALVAAGTGTVLYARRRRSV